MSFVQVKGSGGSSGLERTSFVGARVPPEIRAMIKPLSKLEKSTFKKIMKGEFMYTKGDPNNETFQLLYGFIAGI